MAKISKKEKQKRREMHEPTLDWLCANNSWLRRVGTGSDGEHLYEKVGEIPLDVLSFFGIQPRADRGDK